MHPCPTCGHEIKGRPNFCPACGSSLTYDATGSDPLIGRVIGGTYQIEELIGEGAMGRVYQAMQVNLKKRVALKVLRSNLVSDPTVVKRFEREAQAASRLNHPNCISIFGFGKDDQGDLLWMAMELIQGRDLGNIIATEAPLSVERVVHIMTQVCEALDEAHSAMIIHRDLKPANIVCFDHRRNRDFVKVLDFGIAKITDPDESYQPLTRDGIVCGTPAYMSPEQVQGFELDSRSDLFSLGIILYQALTGRLPFFAESAVEVATKIVIDDPEPPSSVRPEWSYPAELEAVVLNLLQKNKEDRYPTAIAVKDALEACLDTLRERRDASLDLSPAELAEIMADLDQPMSGAATLQFSQDDVRNAMAAQLFPGPAAAVAAPARMPTPPPLPVAAPAAVPRVEAKTPAASPPEAAPQGRTQSTPVVRSARIEQPSTGRRGVVLGALVALAIAAGGVAWWFFGR
ncbi:MAG: serine/threonine-protein kinase [bacterium]